MGRYWHIASLTSIFVLAATAGAVSVFALTTYQKYAQVSEVATITREVGFHRRLVRVQEIDAENNTITAAVLDRGAENTFTRATFTVGESTYIERQDPRIENGVVVSFSPPETVPVAEITPGTEALVRLYVTDDGTLFASNIVLGTPFPLP